MTLRWQDILLALVFGLLFALAGWLPSLFIGDF
jgi:hypothetical protein